jgi:hypothetical protein
MLTRRKAVMENKEIVEIVELDVEELEEKTAPGVIVLLDA